MRLVDVWLSVSGTDNIRVGVLREIQPSGYSRSTIDFTYDQAYRNDERSFELSSDLPLVAGAQQLPLNKTFFSGLADSLPDQWGRRLISQRHAEDCRNAKSPITKLEELDFVLLQDDEFRIGALRFTFHDDPIFQGRPRPIPLNLEKVVRAVLRVDADQANDADYDLVFGLSSPLGGARPKINWRTGSTDQLVKIWRDSDRSLDIEAWEAVSLTIAREAGLRVPDFTHRRFSDSHSLLFINRFDRRGALRIPYQSMRNALGITTSHDGSHSYQEMAEFTAVHTANPSESLDQLFRRAALSIAINDVDDHLQNIGFIRNERGWQIAPAFDINPGPPGEALTSNTWVTRTTDRTDVHNFDALIDDAAVYRKTFDEADRIIQEIKEAVTSWRAIAESLGILPHIIDAYGKSFVKR